MYEAYQVQSEVARARGGQGVNSVGYGFHTPSNLPGKYTGLHGQGGQRGSYADGNMSKSIELELLFLVLQLRIIFYKFQR